MTNEKTRDPKALLEAFGDIMDQAITAARVRLEVELPPGTQEPVFKGTGLATVDFFLLLNAIRPIFINLVEEMGGTDNLHIERVLEELLGMVRVDCMEALEGAGGEEA